MNGFQAKDSNLNESRIGNVLILGAGWVGRQVAARFAQHGVNVWLVDRSSEISEDALQWMHGLSKNEANASAADEPSRSTSDWLARVHTAPTLGELAKAPGLAAELPIELVLECVPEQISLKKRVLRQVSRLFPAPVLIASNSSYFVPSNLAEFVESPERFAHMHFHVPVLEDSIADIVGCTTTAPETLERLMDLSRRVGQEPLLLRHEHPGYIFNWLLQALLRAALELAALDVADLEDIDKSWRAASGMPLGPFEFMDRIGLDVVEQVLANARWAVPPSVDSERLLELLAQHTRQGHLGIKTGRGFYEHKPLSGNEISD